MSMIEKMWMKIHKNSEWLLQLVRLYNENISWIPISSSSSLSNSSPSLFTPWLELNIEFLLLSLVKALFTISNLFWPHSLCTNIKYRLNTKTKNRSKWEEMSDPRYRGEKMTMGINKEEKKTQKLFRIFLTSPHSA